MAVSSQQATPSTAQIVIEILELLDAHTDREHGITATEISKRHQRFGKDRTRASQGVA